MKTLPEIHSWREGVATESAEREVRWLQELIDDADEAIAAQRRIIAHDGPLEAHMLSLASLERSQKKHENRLAALMEQRQIEVLDFALDGPKYAGHRARADVLAGFLHAMQQLYERVGQAIESPKRLLVIPPELKRTLQLDVAGFFPSSFGIRFATPTHADYTGHSITTTALEATFELINAEHPINQLERVGPLAMRKYSTLVKTLVEAEAVPKVSWHTPDGNERRWVIDDNQLLTLNNRLARIHHEPEKTHDATGTLTGASLRRNRFEFTTGAHVITGIAPRVLEAKITQYFGKQCRITYSETIYIDDHTEQQKRSRVLMDITG